MKMSEQTTANSVFKRCDNSEKNLTRKDSRRIIWKYVRFFVLFIKNKCKYSCVGRLLTCVRMIIKLLGLLICCGVCWHFWIQTNLPNHFYIKKCMFTVLHFVPQLLSMELHSVTRTNFDINICIAYVHINHFQIHFVHCLSNLNIRGEKNRPPNPWTKQYNIIFLYFQFKKGVKIFTVTSYINCILIKLWLWTHTRKKILFMHMNKKDM